MLQKKQIIFIYGPLGGGGAERVLLDILSNLDYSKYEIDLCLIVNQGILLPEIPKQINIISLWNKYSLYYKIAYRMSIWFCSNMLFKRVLLKKISKKYDVEISFLEGMPLKLHALIESDARKLTWIHCDMFQFPYETRQFAKNEELKAYNKMDTVICVSKNALSAFEKRFPNCISKKEVIYNPIDIDKIINLANSYPVDKHKFTVVIVGRLTHPKKIDRILRLAARCKNANIDILFRIVGDGELRTELHNQSKELAIESYVEFIGYVQNPYPYIKNADILLLCSGYEGFGLVICEAMCLRVPVISTKTTGPIEILDDNRYGLLCEHDDESIYNAIKCMIDNPTLREHYKTMGLEKSTQFNVRKTIEEIEQLIDEE